MISQIALNHVPYWVVDAIGAPTAVLLAFTVAHAALPAQDFQATDRTPAPAAASVALAQPAGPASAFVFGRPVEGFEVISPFGLRQLPWEEGGRLHAGVDIAAPSGLPARAVADGVVTRTGRDGAYGRFVEVRHEGGLKTFYAHLGSVGAVARGTRVYRGSEIGRIGSTGSSTGSHLHFEVRGAKGQPLNPRYFIDTEYAQAADLPLKEASRIPRGVRRAYVSFIPKIRREQMEAREQAKLDAELAAKAAKEAAKPKAPDTARVQFALNTAQRPFGVYLPARATATMKPEPVRSVALLAKPAAPAPKPAVSAQAALNAAVFARDSEIIQTAGD